MIVLNGDNKENYEEQTIEAMLLSEQYDKKRIAVEVNGKIVSKKNYNQTILHAGDVIEVVSFVGGG